MIHWLRRARRLFDHDPYMVVGYRSYGSAQRVLVRGRAMENEGITAAGDNDSLWRNLVNSYRRIEADPLPHAVIRATVGGATYCDWLLPARAAGDDQAGRLEHAQVLHHAEPRHLQLGFQLAERAAVTLVEPVEEVPPGGVGKRLEDAVVVGHMRYNR